MKRIFTSLLALTLTVSLAACGAAPAEEPDGSQYNLVLQPSVSSDQSEADTSNDTAPAEDQVNESADKDANAPDSDGQAAPSAKPAQSAQKPTTAPAQNTTPSEPEAKSGAKILIAYFTWADNTVVEDRQAATLVFCMIKTLEKSLTSLYSCILRMHVKCLLLQKS